MGLSDKCRRRGPLRAGYIADGRLVVFGLREPVAPDGLSPLHIVVIDWSGKEVRRFNEVLIKDLDTCGYGAVEWIDNSRIGCRS